MSLSSYSKDDDDVRVETTPSLSQTGLKKSYSTSCMERGWKCHPHNNRAAPKNGGMQARSASPVRLVKIQSSTQLREEYDIGRQLGEGAFGSVLLATHKRDGTKWAIKKMAKDKDAKNTYGKSWENEIRIFRSYRHSNIVQVREIYESDNHCYLIMEYCEAGTLDIELGNRRTFCEDDARCLMRQLGSALKYLHANKIVHRDLKLQNILLKQNQAGINRVHTCSVNSGKSSAGSGRSISSNGSASESCPFTAKLTDFGLSIVVRGKDHSLVDNVGTPIYQSPEIVQGKSYSQQCDVWSFGICLYILLHGQDPYRSISNDTDELYEAIRNYNYSQSCQECKICKGLSRNCISVLVKLLAPEPARRFFMGEFMNSPWVSLSTEDRQTFNVLDLMKQVNCETPKNKNDEHQRHSSGPNTTRSPLLDSKSEINKAEIRKRSGKEKS